MAISPCLPWKPMFTPLSTVLKIAASCAFRKRSVADWMYHAEDAAPARFVPMPTFAPSGFRCAPILVFDRLVGVEDTSVWNNSST